MKKSNIISLLFVISALLIMNLHCEKDDPQVDFINSQNQLPPITTTGANTFGCTVNGKNWVAYTDYSFPKLRVSYDESNGSFRVIADRNKKNYSDEDEFDFNIGPVVNIGIYSLGHQLDTLVDGHMFYSPPYAFAKLYMTDMSHVGAIEITKLDKIKRIISGTFEADLAYYDPNISDSIIHIRNGRFDVKY